jgi:hypothetical protein
MEFVFYAYAIEDPESEKIPEPFVRFVGTPQDALAFFFSKGFQFEYTDPLWTDTTTERLYSEFEADGEDIPNRMDIALAAGSPNMEVEDDRTFQLVGIRRIAKKTGGRRKTRRQTRRKGTRRYRNRK